MEKLKELVGRKVVEYIQDGMIVGLGSGSTAACAIRSLGERVAQGLQIKAISTSYASSRLAQECGIELVTLEEEPVIDLTFDGADEVDPRLDLIKGLGGALLREKVIASATTREIILVDYSKMVDRLGTQTPLPVEVVPLAWSLVQRTFVDRGLKPELRVEKDEPFVTDNGNYILHCTFPDGIDDPAATDRWINDIPGVVENGLFVGYTDVVLVGEESGECRTIEKS
ncbi:MAG: ribose-5-phosphate isomerase RpiA [Gemmatimonadetes bacterium]|nr:ribose-5-phosphate isomerase RpiA [Gemmatimonadota bacterium]